MQFRPFFVCTAIIMGWTSSPVMSLAVLCVLVATIRIIMCWWVVWIDPHKKRHHLHERRNKTLWWWSVAWVSSGSHSSKFHHGHCSCCCYIPSVRKSRADRKIFCFGSVFGAPFSFGILIHDLQSRMTHVNAICSDIPQTNSQ